MAKKTANFNVPVEINTAEEFELWHSNLPGAKGDKLAGALKAIQALHCIDSGLAFKLMSASTTVDEAVNLIREVVEKQALMKALDQLTPSQRAEFLVDKEGKKVLLADKKKGQK